MDVLVQAPFTLAAKSAASPCRVGTLLGSEFRGTINLDDRAVRYAAYLPGEFEAAESFVVYLVGGPGTRVLEGLRFRPAVRLLIDAIMRRCRSALIIPAYSGTGDVSNYPDSSIEDAIADLNATLTRVKMLAGRRPVILLTSSLGTYLYAHSKKGLVDAHIGMLPLLRPPQAFMQFVINDTTRGGQAEVTRNRWKQYRIGPGGAEQTIRIVDFTKAFFGQSALIGVSLAEAYQRNPASPAELAASHLFVGEADVEVGPAQEFLPELAAVGISASALQTNGHSIDSANAAAILTQTVGLLSAACAR